MATSVDAKLLKQTKFPPEFNQKVDMKKVNVEVMKKWIAGKLSEILGSEDDVVIELCFNLLEGSRFPDIKVLQIQLTGFLDKDTAKFCKELWTLCLSAQSNAQGVPKELLEAKKLELIQEKRRKQRKKLAVEKNKKRPGTEISRTFDNENAESAVAEEVELGVVAAISIAEVQEIPGHLHLDEEVLPIEASFVALRYDVAEVVGEMKIDDEELVHRRQEAQPPARLPLPDTDEESTPSHVLLGFDILQTDIDHRLRIVLMGEEEGGLLTAVTNGQRPSPLLIPLAHVHLEDTGGGDLLLSHHVVLPHHQDPNVPIADGVAGLCHLHIPTVTVMTRMRRALIIARVENIIKIGIAIVVQVESGIHVIEGVLVEAEAEARAEVQGERESTVSSSLEKRRKRADSSADEASRQLPVRQQDKGSEEAERANPLQAGSTEESKPPIMGATITANALREKLLREKGFLDVVAFFLRSGESCRQPANREGIDTTHHELCQQVSFLISVLHMGALKEGLLPKLYAIPDKPQPELALPKAPPNKSTSPPPKKYSFRHGPYVRRIGETSQLLNHYDSKDKTPPKNHFYHRDGPCASGIEEISQLHNQYDQKPILTATINPRLLLKRSSSSSKKTPTALPITTDERGILDDDPTERPQATLLAEGHSDRLASEQKHVRKAKAVKRLRSTLDPDPLSGHEAFGPGYEADYAEQGRLQELFGAETLADQRPRPAIYGLSPVKLGPLLDLSPSPPPPPSPSPPSPPPASGAQVKNNAPAAGGAASDAADASKANMAYYEKLRSDIRETIQRQRIITKKLVALPLFPLLPLPQNEPQTLSRRLISSVLSHLDLATEDDQIYRMETAYLEETNAGNIIKGFDNYVKGSSTTGSNSANTASGVGGAANRRKGQILEQDRVFSRSSASFSRDSPPPDSATTTPSHAQTPSASFAPAQNGGAANLDTASNITTSTTNGNQKSGTAVKKNNKKASGQSVELEEDGDGGRNKRQKTG
ncbi:MAG: hypothetical protein M1836_004212 [Candelina mexicana]|nr:MAG: hypothetical protein M1836_004212 [Candelina mexicana]